MSTQTYQPFTAHACAAGERSRVVLLDLLRLLAAVQMVQGHTIDGLLAAQFRHGALYSLWLSSRGLTSVAFLFVAGLAFGMTALQAGDSGGPRSRRRLRRAGLLIVLGYALHLPFGLFAGPSAGEAERLLRAGYAVDILQCMGVALFALEGLALLLRNPLTIRACSGLLGLALLAAAPLAHELAPQGPLAPLMAYLTPRAGSLFPLLPWAAHLFLGVAASSLLVSAPDRRLLRFALASVALLGSGAILRHAGVGLTADHVARLGWVLAGAGLLSMLERRASSWPGWLLGLSRETLFIYLFHVVVVYADGVGLAAWVGPSLAPLPAVVAASAMIALSFAGAHGRAQLLQAQRSRRGAAGTALAGSAAPG